jgi:hypothetical protein
LNQAIVNGAAEPTGTPAAFLGNFVSGPKSKPILAFYLSFCRTGISLHHDLKVRVVFQPFLPGLKGAARMIQADASRKIWQVKN